MYELNTAEMIEIAKVVRDYQPVTPQPVPDWKAEVWQVSIERQAISLNPNAALANENLQRFISAGSV
jgi:hypothetical protein